MSKTSKYWKLREQENRQRLKTLEFIDSYNKQIEQTYRRMLDSVQKEIDAFYGRYADKEGITIAEARKRVSQLDIEAYARKAKQYVQDKNFSDKANAEMKLYNLTMKVNRLELLKSNIGLELVNGFDDLEKLFGEKLTEEGIKEFRRQAGILGDTVTDTDSNKRYEKLADRLARASFHNATFSDRIWMHQDLLRNEIDKSLQQALISGRSMERLARDIRNAFGTSTKNAQRLMRTEIRRMQTDVAAESYKKNGNEKYEYMALGQHPCDICSSMNGKVYNVKDMEVGLNAPPMHPNCMCSTAPYVDEKAYQEWLDSLDAENTSVTNKQIDNMSIEELQEYANRYIEEQFMDRTFKGKVDFKGISVENARNIVKALDSVYGMFPELQKLSGIKVVSPTSRIGKKAFPGGEDAVFSYSPVEHGIFVNKNILHNLKSVNEYMTRAQESWDLVMSNIGKLTSEQQKVALRYKEAGRSLVQGDSVEGLFIHEMGHHMQWTGLSTKETNNITANKSKYASNISGYATTSNSEYLAESFSAYMKGEKKKLDPNYVSVLEKKQKRIVSQTAAGENKVLKVKKSIDFPTIRLSKQEYAHVMSELATNMSKEQRQKSIVKKAIGNYYYTVENNGFGDYRIIGKEPIE